MRWRAEEYVELMTFGRIERPMFVELFGLLIGLEEEWRAQGASDDEIALTAFDWDFVERVGCGAHTGRLAGDKPVVLEDTAEYTIQRDDLGRTMKLCKGTATIALPLDWPVKTMDDWLRLKPRYLFREERIDWNAIEAAKAAQAQGKVILAGIPGGFDETRELMGEEIACLAYYDQPEMMHDILQTLRDTALQVLDRVTQKIRVDLLSVHEDFAGKSGPLVGPAQIRDFIQPYFRPIWELVHSRGTKLFSLDSDGNVTPVIDALLDCGVTTIYPMEPAAGMDIVAMRRKYGSRLAMAGGIDKHVLRSTQADIRRELEYKLQPQMRPGMVFGLDHRIPNGTPLANYRYYVDTGREILGLPPRQGRPGWARMAM